MLFDHFTDLMQGLYINFSDISIISIKKNAVNKLDRIGIGFIGLCYLMIVKQVKST